MKRITIILFLLISIGVCAKISMPDIHLGKFGMEYQKSVQEYQKYVGKEVIYIPSIDKKFDYFFLNEGGQYDTHYTITGIKGSNKKFTIYLKECDGDKEIKLYVTNGWSSDLDYIQKQYYWIGDIGAYGGTSFKHTLPLVFIKEFEELKNSLTGRVYSSDPLGHHRFILEDVVFVHSLYYTQSGSNVLNECDKINIGVRFVNPNTHTILEYYLDDLNIIEPILSEVGRVITQKPFVSTYTIIDILPNSAKYDFKCDKEWIKVVIQNSIDGKIKEKYLRYVDQVAFDGDKSGNYSVSLISVDKPANPKIKYGQSTTITEDSISKYEYIDNYVKILLFADYKNINILLENLTQHSIRVIWDDAVFVDVDGTISRVIHKGTKYAQKDESIPPSVIIKGTTLADFIAPTSRIFYSEGWYQESLCATASQNKKEIIKLMLPIQIQDVINEYIFTFEVEWKYDHSEYFK